MVTIDTPNVGTAMIDCDSTSCKRCKFIEVFEYPWVIKKSQEEDISIEIKFCKIFSRWAQTIENKILLPEPLPLDENCCCQRLEKCIKSEVKSAQAVYTTSTSTDTEEYDYE